MAEYKYKFKHSEGKGEGTVLADTKASAKKLVTQNIKQGDPNLEVSDLTVDIGDVIKEERQ